MQNIHEKLAEIDRLRKIDEEYDGIDDAKSDAAHFEMWKIAEEVADYIYDIMHKSPKCLCRLTKPGVLRIVFDHRDTLERILKRYA